VSMRSTLRSNADRQDACAPTNEIAQLLEAA
jgi:hypothetical protein